MSLNEYHRKRDFKRTSEPFGGTSRSQEELIFVVQKHAASHLHYDFRLELNGVLLSWAVPKGPSLDPKVKRLAMHVEDHPLDYADFEGIIPKGQYGGGTVMVWDQGIWIPESENPKKDYHAGNLTFTLQGKKLKGKWKLIRTKRNDDDRSWLLFKLKDKYSRDESEYNITEKKSKSALTKRSMEQIARDSDAVWSSNKSSEPKKKISKKIIDPTNLPGIVKSRISLDVRPELATLVTQPPSGDQWLHEIKWDGYRILCIIKNSKITLLTRRGNDWTSSFPQLVKEIKRLEFENIILDGELVAFNEKKLADFQILQNSIEEGITNPALFYYVFDLLYYDNYNLMNVPLIHRKELLKSLIAKKSQHVKYNDHIIGSGNSTLQNACQLGLEGIVSKKISSRYTQKRTKEWLKIKCVRRQEFVIGGFTDPKSSRSYFGALLLGFYDENNDLIYCGKVGTGFSELSLQEISEHLFKLKQEPCPFTNFPKMSIRGIHWVKPTLVCEIEYLEMTQDGILRHPSFKGLRSDKKSQSVKLEKAKEISNIDESQTHTVVSKKKLTKEIDMELSNPNRVLYPDQNITKEDLANYYAYVADWILPHIINRPLTIVRCPRGHTHECFYQKHVNESLPKSIKSVDIIEKDSVEPYIYIKNLAGLIGLVQMSALELHPWGSKVDNPELPDRMIFDLDPAPEVPWMEVIQCAKLIRDFLFELKLISFVKTTGGKGLHVVVPIQRKTSWEELGRISGQIAALIVQMNANKYIATMSKAKRKNKIFIDYLRNARGATAIAAYSTRARTGAPIAVPLAWEELTSKVTPNGFNMENIHRRLNKLKKDPWEEFFSIKQSLNAWVKKMLGL